MFKEPEVEVFICLRIRDHVDLFTVWLLMLTSTKVTEAELDLIDSQLY